MLDDQSTAQLISRGRVLTRIIAESQTELKAIEEELRHRALAMAHEPLADGNREGRRARLRDGNESLTVLFESDVLKASFDSNSPTAAALLPLLTKPQIDSLFRCKTTYERAVKDGHKFRLQCAELLEPDLASTVIDKLKDRDRHGIVKSKSVIEWKV